MQIFVHVYLAKMPTELIFMGLILYARAARPHKCSSPTVKTHSLQHGVMIYLYLYEPISFSLDRHFYVICVPGIYTSGHPLRYLDREVQ